MKNDHTDGEDRSASYESPKIVVTHHPIEGQRVKIDQPAGGDDMGMLAGHTAKVFYNYVEEHLPFPELPISECCTYRFRKPQLLSLKISSAADAMVWWKEKKVLRQAVKSLSQNWWRSFRLVS